MSEIPSFRYRRSEWESNNKPINTDIKNGFNIYNDVESQESEVGFTNCTFEMITTLQTFVMFIKLKNKENYNLINSSTDYYLISGSLPCSEDYFDIL